MAKFSRVLPGIFLAMFFRDPLKDPRNSHKLLEFYDSIKIERICKKCSVLRSHVHQVSRFLCGSGCDFMTKGKESQRWFAPESFSPQKNRVILSVMGKSLVIAIHCAISRRWLLLLQPPPPSSTSLVRLSVRLLSRVGSATGAFLKAPRAAAQSSLQFWLATRTLATEKSAICDCDSWWTFRIFFYFFSARGGGRGSPRCREGERGSVSYWKSQEGEGASRTGGAGRASVANLGNFFG